MFGGAAVQSTHFLIVYLILTHFIPNTENKLKAHFELALNYVTCGGKKQIELKDALQLNQRV